MCVPGYETHTHPYYLAVLHLNEEVEKSGKIIRMEKKRAVFHELGFIAQGLWENYFRILGKEA